MTITLTQALDRHQISVADDLLADIEVPVLTGPQRQGDILITPRGPAGKAELARFTPVPAEGVAVVRGEATGNTHLLDALAGVVMWAPNPASSPTDLTLGILHVPAGGVALLIHTDEHGANAVGPGTYRLAGKREMADEIRRVAD